MTRKFFKKLVLHVPSGLLAVMLVACSSQHPVAQVNIGNQTLNVARTALRGGNPQMALTVTNAVLKSAPHDAEALVERGDAYFALRNCVSAAADYHAVLRLSPRSAAAELGLGRCALSTDPRAAAASFRLATEDAPTSGAAYNDLGIAEADQSNFSAAQAAFRSALAINPAMQAANVNLGLALALGGKPGEAVTILGPIARGAASDPTVRADYATALALAGHPRSANHILLADMPAVEAQAMVNQMVKLNGLSSITQARPSRG